MIVGMWLVYNSSKTLQASVASVWPYIDAAVFVDGDFDGHPRSMDATQEIIGEFADGSSAFVQAGCSKRVDYVPWSGRYPCQKRNVHLSNDLCRSADWIWQVDSDEVWPAKAAQWARQMALAVGERCHTLSAGLLTFTHSLAFYHEPTSQGTDARLFRAGCLGPWDHRPGNHERFNWRCNCDREDLVSPLPFLHYQVFQTPEEARAKLSRYLRYDGCSPGEIEAALMHHDIFRPLEHQLAKGRLIPFAERHPEPVEKLFRDRLEVDYARAGRSYP